MRARATGGNFFSVKPKVAQMSFFMLYRALIEKHKSLKYEKREKQTCKNGKIIFP